MSAQRTKTQVFENERDRSLVAAVRSGDRTGLEELYCHYHERVYRSCLHTCRDPEDAIDATQEAFLNVFRRISDIDLNISSFRDYLFMTSRNISLKIIAKRGRSTPTSEPPEPDGLIRATDDPERSALIGVQREIVRRATGSLNQRQVDALTMYEIEGKSYSEIGEYLGIEANAVAQLLMRSRISLKKAVRRHVAQTPSNDGCSDALSLLSKKTDGKLHDGERDWLDSHLNGCNTCSTNLLVMEEVGASYRSLVPVPAALIFERVFSDEALAGILEQSGHSGTSAKTHAKEQEVGKPTNNGFSDDCVSHSGVRSALHSRKRGNCNENGSKIGWGTKTAALTVALLLVVVAAISQTGLNGKAELDGATVSKARTDRDWGMLVAGFGGLVGGFHKPDASNYKHSTGSGNQGFTRSEKKVLQYSSARAKTYSNLTNDGHVQVIGTENTGALEGSSTKVGQRLAAERKHIKKSKPGAKAKKKSCEGVKCKGPSNKKSSGPAPTPTKQVNPAQQSQDIPPLHPVISRPDRRKSDPRSENNYMESAEESKSRRISLTIPKLKNNVPKKDCKPLDISC